MKHVKNILHLKIILPLSYPTPNGFCNSAEPNDSKVSFELHILPFSNEANYLDICLHKYHICFQELTCLRSLVNYRSKLRKGIRTKLLDYSMEATIFTYKTFVRSIIGSKATIISTAFIIQTIKFTLVFVRLLENSMGIPQRKSTKLYS